MKKTRARMSYPLLVEAIMADKDRKLDLPKFADLMNVSPATLNAHLRKVPGLEFLDSGKIQYTGDLEKDQLVETIFEAQDAYNANVEKCRKKRRETKKIKNPEPIQMELPFEPKNISDNKFEALCAVVKEISADLKRLTDAVELSGTVRGKDITENFYDDMRVSRQGV